MASKYYWLKLQRNFFKRHDIRIIESMPNGKDYILFYLKLLCESIDHDGTLRFSEEIPYNEDMLSTITNTNVDIVRSAIKVFTQLHMMEILDDGTYYMNEVNRMIGSETAWAEKKRLYREQLKALQEDNVRTKKDNVRQEKEIEKELDTDKDIEIEKDNININLNNNIHEHIDNNPPIIPPRGKGKKKTEPKIDFKKMVDEKMFPDVIAEKVFEWLKYKSEIKKPYNTETGFNTFLKRVKTHLIKYGEEAVIDVIDESMANGYQGVIWDKLKKSGTGYKQTKAQELDDFYSMANEWAQKGD